MPAFLNWLLRLLPTNPIVMRIVQGGSKRLRHLYIRSGYLAILIVVLLLLMVGGTGTATFASLAQRGATAFEWISYLQLGLICLLTPVFMAGAIAQEANPRTWDILLTTPLNNLQIVLGNMCGRLFFILALLISTLPLFVAIQYFGGVPGESIFLSYAISGGSAILVAAIAVTLSVTRTAGRRAVFIFYITVIMYLFITYAIDRQMLRQPIAPAAAVSATTLMTPLNPFLALEVLLRSTTYQPRDYTGEEVFFLTRLWFSRPIGAFLWVCMILSTALVLFSTIRLRVIGAKTGTVPWYRRLLRLGAKGSAERPPRKVGHNPIAWREAVARGNTLPAIITRWGFAALGLVIALIVVALFHGGAMTPGTFRTSIAVIVCAEIVIIALTALNTSATAVSREREDGSLDILLTTPIQPGPYLYGKLQGLIQFLLPMLCVPVGTFLIVAFYVMLGGMGNVNVVSTVAFGAHTASIPVLFPEGAIALPLVLVPFIAFCVMVGLQWSIKSRGTISAVISAVGVVIAVAGVVGLCGIFAGRNIDFLGAVLNAFNPVNLVVSSVSPHTIVQSAMGSGTDANLASTRVSLVVGSVIAGGVFVLVVYGMHTNMKRTFHMTVRKLAGQK